MTEYTVLDLFCGLGGFSSAFTDSERWDVTTVDIQPEFDPDIVADVFDLKPSDFGRGFDVILASPPCPELSPAANHDHWDFENRKPTHPSAKDAVALAVHTVGLIQGLAPRFWFVENPKGRLRWFLGEPQGWVTYCQYGKDYMKPTELWGSHPPMEYKRCSQNAPCHKRNVDHDGTSAVASMDGSSAKRAKVPHELSDAIRVACEDALEGRAQEQATMEGWL